MAPRQPVFLPGLRHPDNRSFFPAYGTQTTGLPTRPTAPRPPVFLSGLWHTDYRGLSTRPTASRQPTFLPGLRHPDNRSFYPVYGIQTTGLPTRPPASRQPVYLPGVRHPDNRSSHPSHWNPFPFITISFLSLQKYLFPSLHNNLFPFPS